MHEWISDTVARRWRGTRAVDIAELRGDASARRFWRVRLPPGSRRIPSTAIAIDLGPDDLPRYARAIEMYPKSMAEPPWLNLHRYLSGLGVPVPELYEWSPQARMMLVEDVGEVSLFDAARRDPADAGDLYREAVSELLRIHVEATAHPDPRCVAFKVAYDVRLFAWEMEDFAAELPSLSAEFDREVIGHELDALASRLGKLPRVLSHRDFHGGNLFVQQARGRAVRIRIIDFQDALMAPAAQDLSVLLTTRDTGELITPAIEQKLLDFYYTGAIRRKAPVPAYDDFIASYRLCVLQHALKCVGRFARLEREGKPGYKVYIPHALGQARRMLAELAPEFPNLRIALAS